jgi:ABC-type multidrug transport system fused ATPase/permease subunit
MRTVRGADCIFVIDGGVVVEGGRHEELVGRSEAYREMVAHQTLGL